MIIVNADDWGRSRTDTDTALFCYKEGRITSVSAMVFMEDSGRSAELAKDSGIDVGLHLNLSMRFTGNYQDRLLHESHSCIIHFLTFHNYTLLLYKPALRKQFRYVYQAQVEEFIRLYGRPPSHIDGHHHMHLCTNMLLDRVIPVHEKVRRNFSFFPGEKGIFNILYRRLVDRWLSKRYFLADYFFALSQLIKTDRIFRVFELGKSSTVEIETHPCDMREYDFLMSDEYLAMLNSIEKGTYASI